MRTLGLSPGKRVLFTGPGQVHPIKGAHRVDKHVGFCLLSQFSSISIEHTHAVHTFGEGDKFALFTRRISPNFLGITEVESFLLEPSS